ncbi:hypothetical protein Tco_1294538 [Tanacetum coccineum]
MGLLLIGIIAMVIENKVVTVMSSYPHSTIVPFDYDTEDAFSYMNIINYFPASPGNISPNSLDDFTKYLLDILFFPPLHDDPYVQTYDAIPPPQVIIALPTIVPPPMFDPQNFYPPKNISSPKDTETPVESTTQVSLSSSMESSSPIRSTTSPPDYLFDKFIFAELDNSLWIISQTLGSKPILEKREEMPPKRSSTSATPAITQDAIRQLIAGIAAALEAQAAAMCAKEDRVTFAIVKKMEDEFYNLVVKGNDLKTYIRRFQELAVLCPNMVPNSEKLMEAFIGGLP